MHGRPTYSPKTSSRSRAYFVERRLMTGPRGVSSATTRHSTKVEVSADEARRVALWAQGLLGTPKVPRSEGTREQSVVNMLEHL